MNPARTPLALPVHVGRATDSTLKVTITRAEAGEHVPLESAPTRVVTVTIDERARRSSPPPSVAVTPVVEVATPSQRRLASQALTKTYGVAGPPQDLGEAPSQDPVTPQPSTPEPSIALGAQELPRVRSGRGEPEWSSKPTEMDLPRIGDFISDDELISTRAPTPRLLPRMRSEPPPSAVTSGLVAVISLLALALVLAAIIGLAR